MNLDGQLLAWAAHAAVGMAFVLLAVPALSRIAPHVGLLDRPTRRKRHDGLVPLVGGLAMFFAFVVGLLAMDMLDRVPAGFLAAATILVLIGALDDRSPMSSRFRLAMQALVLLAATLATANVLDSLGLLVGPQPLTLGVLAIPFTVFGLLGVTNAMNFIDGVDGLAGGVALTALASFAAVFLLIGADSAWPGSVPDVRAMTFALAGTVLGFLVFNMRTPWRRRAAIFMGDAGSVFLGFAIGWLAVFACSRFGESSLAPVAALWILIVPLFDTLSSMARRALDGRSPLRADRDHVHHLLQSAGLPPAWTVVVLIAVNATGGAIGILAWRTGVPDWAMFALLAVLFVAWVWTSRTTWRRVRRRLVRPVQLRRVYPAEHGPASASRGPLDIGVALPREAR